MFHHFTCAFRAYPSCLQCFAREARDRHNTIALLLNAVKPGEPSSTIKARCSSCANHNPLC